MRENTMERRLRAWTIRISLRAEPSFLKCKILSATISIMMRIAIAGSGGLARLLVAHVMETANICLVISRNVRMVAIRGVEIC